MRNDFPSFLTCIFYIFPFFTPGKQPYFEISEMTTHTPCARDIWWTLDFASAFLSPGVNSRTELVPSPRAQWRNVISGGPRFKIFEGPPSRSAKGTSWAPYMHEFSRGSRACSSGKFLNLHSLKCHFLDFGERFYRILMVRKRHCNISEALANVFALSPKPGGPHLAHWGWGPPGSPGLSP
jgi:hypothetical protein